MRRLSEAETFGAKVALSVMDPMKREALLCAALQARECALARQAIERSMVSMAALMLPTGAVAMHDQHQQKIEEAEFLLALMVDVDPALVAGLVSINPC